MVENQELAEQVLDSVYSIQEAGIGLLDLANENKKEFYAVAQDTLQLLDVIEKIGRDFSKEDKNIKLHLHCVCMKSSLKNIITLSETDPKRCKMKLEFEFVCMARGAYAFFYYWAMVYPDKEKLARFEESEAAPLMENHYIRRSMEKKSYKYKVSFMVVAYNKLDYTKMCIENLLKNIPKNLNYELILYNNGSDSETKVYFESIHPTKQIDISVNGADCTMFGFVEGEYFFPISNDVIICKNSISNMLKCIESDDRIAWVVPSTSNISNLQSLDADYNSFDKMTSFAEKNNISDPGRWEQRVRLCNPLEISRSSVYLTNDGILWPYRGFCAPASDNAAGFPDDRFSLFIRRKNYKMFLAKDAFCHHFGSVTIKNEIHTEKETEYYNNGRKAFLKLYGIDPWGTGFCYDPVFLTCVVENAVGHINILGINCGLGSNSLRIKEQLKEYYHNTDSTLTNITDNKNFFLDLKGISDEAEAFFSNETFRDFLKNRRFNYVVWETEFLTNYSFKILYEEVCNALSDDGKLFIGLTKQSKNYIVTNYPNIRILDGKWAVIEKG